MRFHAAALAAAIASSVLAGCQDLEACHPEAHCQVADRVDGACQCTEWEVVDSKVVDLPYVVAAVLYPPAGDASTFHYGGTFQWRQSDPFELSPVGARWRAQVRGPAGEATVARAIPELLLQPGWRLDAVTPATVALTSPKAQALAAEPRVDVPDHARDDLIGVWVNPRATVEADWLGGRTIRWSASDAMPACGAGPVRLAWLRPGQLLAGDPVEDACAAAFLATLDDPQRAALAAYDAFFSAEGATPQTIFDSDRYETFSNRNIYFLIEKFEVDEWTCLAPPSDADFRPLAQAEWAIPGGETLVLEHTALATAGACAPRALALVEATTSEGCQIGAALELDLAFGTVFHVAGTQWEFSGTAACSR